MQGVDGSRKKQPITFNYHISSTKLHRVQEEKDLGVLSLGISRMDSHIQLTISMTKANKL